MPIGVGLFLNRNGTLANFMRCSPPPLFFDRNPAPTVVFLTGVGVCRSFGFVRGSGVLIDDHSLSLSSYMPSELKCLRRIPSFSHSGSMMGVPHLTFARKFPFDVHLCVSHMEMIVGGRCEGVLNGVSFR